MWLRIYFALAAFALTANAYDFKTCAKTYKKIGCYEDKNHDMVMLENYRDTRRDDFHQLSPVYWKKFNQTMHSLACECIKIAQSKGMDYIQIGFYGECKGGKDFASDIITRKEIPNDQCVNTKFKKCVTASDLDCVGKAHTGYIYLVEGGRDRNERKVDGGYSYWSEWTECSSSCGRGIQERERQCDSPLPKGGGKDCSEIGEPFEIKDCNLRECPVDGGFTDWSQYEKCSATCGGGFQKSTRSCTNPAPKFGGQDCVGDVEKTRDCGTKPCPVDGGWSLWDDYGECSKECGGGVQVSKRSCTNPSPAHGGKECVGVDERSRECNTFACPVDGGFGKWSEYDTCTATCGGGTQTSTRQCDSPSPANGGQDCAGESERVKECGMKPCPVDGGFSAWSDYSACPVTCGGATQTSTRTCTNPTPAHGGEKCVGKTTREKSCANNPCPVDGGFTAWSEYGSCSEECGGGIQESKRSCTNPAPEHGGKDCVGDTERTKQCNTQACPIDGEFTVWSEFTKCTVSCGGGVQESRRSCTNPAPEHGGEECFGPVMRTRACNTKKCPINGGFSKWGEYSVCSEECGGGTQSRTRTCTNPKPQYGGEPCSGDSLEERDCNVQPCPVNGKYSSWSAYSKCSASCGGGSQKSTRTCSNPAPAHGGAQCQGDAERTRECGTKPCPVDGGLTKWSEFGACTASCGGGEQTATRSCTNPSPAHGGKGCLGELEKVRECGTAPCPVDGGFTDWTQYGECTKSCGGGSQTSTRTCTNPSPAHGGQECDGSTMKTRTCNSDPCPVDGGFSKWSEFDKCSTTCGGGYQTKTRSCNNPAPAHGGKSCSGETEMTQSCNSNPCPVDGGFTAWSKYSICSATCGNGIATSTRSCTNPAPANGGDDCVGLKIKSKKCFVKHCPVNGGLTDWSEYDTCTEKCGGGTQTSTRSCTNPRPAHGGDDCDGELERTRSCGMDPCPVDGGLTKWSDYDQCSKPCGGGYQTSTRTCTNPLPAHGGKECTGETDRTRECNTHHCPVDGGLSQWSSYGKCSDECGGGIQESTRSCSNPSPAHGGKPCSGELSKTRACNEHECPVDGGYTPWSAYGKCSKVCGTGVQFSTRTCTDPKPKFGGEPCTGLTKKSRNCNTHPCPVNGNWGAFGSFTTCTRTCGGGIQKRYRKCDSPAAAHGGKKCPGLSFQFKACNTVHCPVDGGYTQWSSFGSCTATCGGGSQTSTRTCTNPSPKYGGEGCVGPSEKTRTCGTKPCPVNGGYTEWGEYSKCSEECGGGIKTKSRSCTNPAPAHGGKGCQGSSSESAVCNEQPCPVDGNWSAFGPLSVCSRTCGGGTSLSKRTCTSPSPKYGGKSCSGSRYRIVACNTRICPIHGGFTAWSNYGVCSEKCGGGVQTATRSCTNPRPLFGGKACVGSSRKSRICNSQPCPVNGGFSDWSAYGKCSKSCGSGIQVSSRTCTNPAPAHGGKSCAGPLQQSRVCNTLPCPVNGNWGSFGRFEECSVSCGGGVQKRFRPCNNPSPAHGGKACRGLSFEIQACNTKHCPIDGKYGSWSSYSKCSVTCGGGTQVKTRKCNSPAPAYGGKNCVGVASHIQACSTHHCPVNGGLTSWSSFDECSEECGGGIQERSRSCTNPAPAHGGKSCVGALVDSRKCNTHKCPVDGGFTKWSSYGSCSKSCGGGSQTSTRSCTLPKPAYGGDACVGPTIKTRGCNSQACPVNGNWGGFGVYGTCSKSCGGGTQKRYRRCNNPAAAHGGKQCSGLSYQIKACNTHHCPVNGNWGTWGSFATCSKPCGKGVQKRVRKCNNPSAAYNGKACPGLDYQLQACNTHHCPVNGNWGAFGPYEACSKSCGGGTQKRHRRCNSPSPAYRGKTCSGSSYQQRSCNTQHCPVHGKWGTWGSYGACSARCGGGIQKRYRSCNKPSAAYGGKACPGASYNIKSCNTQHCPVNGNWGSWGSYTTCTKSCGGGTQKKSRSCNNPAAKYGGKACPGSSYYLKTCNTHHCPVNGNWGSWGSYTTCTKSCGGGTQKKYRTCNSPTAKYGGKACSGSNYYLKTCNTHHCPVNGNWGSWGSYTACTKSCGGGTQKKYRTCTSPLAKYGGKACPGSNYYLKTCNTHHCPVNANWGSWGSYSPCSTTCGGGTQKRYRSCSHPAAKYGGKGCSGLSYQLKACNTHHCKVNGNWGSWGSYSTCSKTCGGGTRKRYRACNNPTVKYGGKACSGLSYQLTTCNTHHCRVNGNWSTWGAYSACSKSCGGGIRKRYRQCNNPAPQAGGSKCSGSSMGFSSCNPFPCRRWSYRG